MDSTVLKISPIPFAIDEEGITGFIKWRLTPRLWIVTEDFHLYCNYLRKWIMIPKGFVFDGASIPKILHFAVNPTDAILFGALVHDFIYRFNQLITRPEGAREWALEEDLGREQADILLREISLQFDHIKPITSACYYVLRAVGGFAWSRSRKRNFKLESPYPSHDNEYLRKGLVI